MLNLGVAHLVDGEPDTARGLIGDAVGAFVDAEDADGLAEVLEATVGLAVADEKWAIGIRLAGASAVYRELMGLVAPEPDRVMIDRWTAQCRAQLSDADVERALAEGAQMTWEQAAAYARSEVLGGGPADP